MGELDHGVGTQRSGDPSGANGVANLHHAAIAIEVNEVEGEPHEEGVNGFARDNPEALAGRKHGAAEESLVASGGGIGDFNAAPDLGLLGGVAHTQESGWAGFLRAEETFHEGWL
jgi:hypothetical protein